MRVLLIRNDFTLSDRIDRLLRGMGAVIDYADSGEEAIARARHTCHDIVLIDLLLPDMQDSAVISQLRAAQVGIPMLILAAATGPRARLKAFALGADDVLAKPFDNRELITRMQNLVRRSRGVRTVASCTGRTERRVTARAFATEAYA